VQNAKFEMQNAEEVDLIAKCDNHGDHSHVSVRSSVTCNIQSRGLWPHEIQSALTLRRCK